jgi:hypothetical protein
MGACYGLRWTWKIIDNNASGAGGHVSGRPGQHATTATVGPGLGVKTSASENVGRASAGHRRPM